MYQNLKMLKNFGHFYCYRPEVFYLEIFKLIYMMVLEILGVLLLKKIRPLYSKVLPMITSMICFDPCNQSPQL